MPEFLKCCDSCGDFLAHSQSDKVIGDRLLFASFPRQLRGLPGVKTITHSHIIHYVLQYIQINIVYCLYLYKKIAMYFTFKYISGRTVYMLQQWNVFRTHSVYFKYTFNIPLGETHYILKTCLQ